MTGKEFDKVFEEQVQSCRDIMGRKGPDYDDGKDRLSNFKVVAGMVGVDPKIVLGVYAAKHFLAVMNYCGRGKVESEPIEGRISDLLNYGVLLKALIEDAKHSVDWVPPQDETLSAEIKEVSNYMSVITNIGEMDATKIQVVPTFPEREELPPLTADEIQALFQQQPEPPTLNLWEKLKQLASS